MKVELTLKGRQALPLEMMKSYIGDYREAGRADYQPAFGAFHGWLNTGGCLHLCDEYLQAGGTNDLDAFEQWVDMRLGIIEGIDSAQEGSQHD